MFVNGKRFETDHASFLVDDQPGTQSDLKLGMTVAVTGTLSNNQRSATLVRQQDAVEGLVQSVAADGLSLVVMGQTVLVDNTTIIDNNIPGQNILNLLAGTDFVEVSGHVRPSGVIQATFIEKKPAGTVTPGPKSPPMQSMATAIGMGQTVAVGCANAVPSPRQPWSSLDFTTFLPR